MSKWVRIAGPPGTGKTHKMMEILDDLLTRYPPERIAFVSFTRAAVAEAVSRASKRIVVGDDTLRYFKTAHGIAYNLLQLNQTKSNVVELKSSNKMWAAFCNKALSGADIDEDTEDDDDDGDFDEFAGSLPDERSGHDAEILASFISLARNKYPLQKDYSDLAKRHDTGTSDLTPDALNKHTISWMNLLESQSKHDFTRMLEFCLEKKISPSIDAMIVDEGQDLSPLQMEVIKMWGEGAKELYMASDIDQAIYVWQGAEPKLVLDLPTEKEMPLMQSYRCPKAIAVAAKKLISRNTIRTGVDWQPTGDEGVIEHLNDLPIQEIADAEKYGVPCFILARNQYFIKSYVVPMLVEAGIPFSIPKGTYGVPPPRKEIRAILDLSTSGTARKADLRTLIKRLPGSIFTNFNKKGGNNQKTFLGLKRRHIDPTIEGLKNHGIGLDIVAKMSNFKTGLEMLLDKGVIHNKVYGYYIDLLKKRNPSVLTAEPSIRVSTIHGSKGGEAERVYLLTCMTRRTSEGEAEDPEAERRVWYVAMTRTRKYLGLIDYETSSSFRYNEVY